MFTAKSAFRLTSLNELKVQKGLLPSQRIIKAKSGKTKIKLSLVNNSITAKIKDQKQGMLAICEALERFETLIFIKAREKMNNINENRTDKRTPGGEKNKAELKWFILFLAVHLFSADHHPRGGGMVYKRRCLCHRHHRVYASRHCLWRLGLVAVIIALSYSYCWFSPTQRSCKRLAEPQAFCFASPPLSSLSGRSFWTSPTSSARKQPVWSGWSLNIREGSGTMVRKTIICAA